MWLRGQTESFQNVGMGGEGVHDVLTLQKGARAHLEGQRSPSPK